jgi:hypothetical protein
MQKIVSDCKQIAVSQYGSMEQFLRKFTSDIGGSLQVIDFLVYSHSV